MSTPTSADDKAIKPSVASIPKTASEIVIGRIRERALERWFPAVVILMRPATANPPAVELSYMAPKEFSPEDILETLRLAVQHWEKKVD